MTQPLRIGIAGLGNVGASVVRLLSSQSKIVEQRVGRPVTVVAVSARDESKDRGCDLSGYTWYHNALDMVDDVHVDLIVELIGGADGLALALVEKALSSGKSVVTANKALVATHADKIQKALTPNTSISYEAAVAGAIPVIKGLREGLSANNVQAVYGILNGTCNFILSTMQETGREFADVLAEAQALGYAEADPTFDIDGMDTAHKLTILAGISFAGLPNIKQVRTSGIRKISGLDIALAYQLGCRIKLLGVARKTDAGIEQCVEPCLVSMESPLAMVGGAMNAVYVETDYANTSLWIGNGAGGDPTASAVVADIIDVARGRALSFLGVEGTVPVLAGQPTTIGEDKSYYIRWAFKDFDINADEVMDMFEDEGMAPGQAFHQEPEEDLEEEKSEWALVVDNASLEKIKDVMQKLTQISNIIGDVAIMPIMDV